METAHIEEFRRVAELGSFTLAARELHMTQSALSKHVAALERELSVDLFTRDKNGISLTPEGEILYQQSVNFTRFLTNLRILLSSTPAPELTDDTCSFAPIPDSPGQTTSSEQSYAAQATRAAQATQAAQAAQAAHAAQATQSRDAAARVLPPLAASPQTTRNATRDQHIPSAAIRKRCHELRSQYNLTTDETCTLILFLEDAGFDAIQHELGFSRDQVADTLVSVYQKLHVTSKSSALRLVLGQ